MKNKYIQCLISIGIFSTVLVVAGCASKTATTEKRANQNAELSTESVSDDEIEVAPEEISSSEKTTPNKIASSVTAKLAKVEYQKGRFALAESYITKAIKQEPNKSELYHNLGLIFIAKGEQREALKAFRQGLQINPEDDAIAAQMGAIYVKEKDFAKAEIALEIPVSKGTKDASILNNYAIVLTASNKISEAEKNYEKGLKANPSSRDLLLNYSMFLIEHKKKYQQALDLLNRLKFVGVEPEVRNIINVLENRAKAGLK
jgi:Tfp pilus assembly protein PilF